MLPPFPSNIRIKFLEIIWKNNQYFLLTASILFIVKLARLRIVATIVYVLLVYVFCYVSINNKWFELNPVP